MTARSRKGHGTPHPPAPPKPDVLTGPSIRKAGRGSASLPPGPRRAPAPARGGPPPSTSECERAAVRTDPATAGGRAVAVTGSAFSLVGGAAPDPEIRPDAAVVPVAQASSDDDPVTEVFETAVQPIDQEPEIADAAGLVKAAQLAEQEVARAAEQA